MFVEVYCHNNPDRNSSSSSELLCIFYATFESYAEDLAKTPGPARYGATENNNYLKKQPQESGRNRSGEFWVLI